jgi:dUTP pyrophosphatase
VKQVEVAVRRLPHGEGLDLPAYATADSAGLDLLAAVEQPVTLLPGQRGLIPTGLAIALPAGCSTRRARSTRTIAARSV